MTEQLFNYNQELSFRLQQDIAKYQEANQIFRKLDYVGYIHQIYDLFYNIMNSEYQFTVQELKKFYDLEAEKFDFQEKYQLNSLIFKSNFQIICNSIQDYLWVLFFNKIQQEFQRDNSNQVNKSIEQSSSNKKDQREDRMSIDTIQNLKAQLANENSQQFQELRGDTFQNVDFQNQNHHQQRQTNNCSSNIKQEFAKVKQMDSQYEKQISQQQEILSQKQREDLIRESFIEDQQEKLNKYLNYEQNGFTQNQAQSNMSVINLQKNLEWIIQNYPDLDKVIKPLPIKKDNISSINVSRVMRHESTDFLLNERSNETELAQLKMMKDTLDDQQNVKSGPPIENNYQQNRNQHFDRKFSTLKPQEFQDKLAQIQQQDKEKAPSSQISTQNLKIQRYHKQQSGSIHKDVYNVSNQQTESQKQQYLRHSATQFYASSHKKNFGDNIFYCDDNNEDFNSKQLKNQFQAGSQSTRIFCNSSNITGKRSPSYAFSKTPKISVFSQQVKLTENVKYNKYQ
ncbi:hypothetical protein ABPG72_004362 [Tetrahymena utriculariae]